MSGRSARSSVELTFEYSTAVQWMRLIWPPASSARHRRGLNPDEPPDAGARLERMHHTVGARELGEQRAERLRERLGDPRWRVVLVDQPEGLGGAPPP
jgi:hypothetical protein